MRTTAEHLGQEVVLNGNTREHSLDQYTSMVVEKMLAGPSKVDRAYVNFYPSSELTASITRAGALAHVLARRHLLRDHPPASRP